MIGFLVRRAGGTLVLLLLLSFTIYALIGLMPGDPIDIMISADPNFTADDAARLKALYGVDAPLIDRYSNWLFNALEGEFGYSRLFARPVGEVIAEYLPRTLLLMGTSLAIALAIALPLGVLAARRPRSVFDHAVNLLAFAGFSIPSFWLGLLLIMLFAVQLGWLPAGGTRTVGVESMADAARYLVLPVLTLTLLTAGTLIRFVRAAMIESLREDFIRTARAKGCSEQRMLMHHALRNASLPIITVTALQLGNLFSGSLVVETIFGYLGMGKLIYDAILGNDFNLALAGLMIAALVTLLANLLADVLYAFADPRIDLRAAH